MSQPMIAARIEAAHSWDGSALLKMRSGAKSILQGMAPVMRTSLESVRLSNTCDVMLNMPASRLTTRGKPRAASAPS